MKKFSLWFFFLGLSPLLIFAHGTSYLEFNPDYFKTKSLNVSTAGVLYEIFLPANEFFGGVDFWFDNTGSSGTATFELRDENNNFIISKTFTIPHINPVQGGQRVHVDWNSQVSVIGSNKYRIKISSAMSQLQIYYSDRVKFLGHNEPQASDYLNGVAEINGEEKEFSFKYALYETTETSAPIISNVAWTVISENQMQLEFNANEPVDYKIEYGISGQGYTQSTNFVGEYNFCAQGVSNCSLLISVLPSTNYQYLITAKDSWGNQSQANGTFTSGQGQTPTPTPLPTGSESPTPTGEPSPSTTPTPSGTVNPSPLPSQSSPPDNNSPVISNLRVVELTSTSVEVAWTTSEIANSHLLISTPFLITVTDASDSTMELEHLLKVDSGLAPNTSYVATVTSIDQGSNEVRASINFTTLPPIVPTGSPIPSPQQSNQQNQIMTSSSGTIQWNPPADGEPSDGYRIDIFDKNGNLVKTVKVPSGSYGVDLSDLGEGDYSVIVYTNNDEVFEKISQPVQLTAEDERFMGRLLGLWPYLSIVLVLGGVLWWQIKKRQTSQISQQPLS